MTGLSLEMLWRRIGLEWTAIARSVLPGIAITALTAIPPTGVALTMGFSDADLWRSMLIAGGGSAAAWLVSVRHELASIMSWLARKLSNAAG
jgi:hypothetical protein